MLDEVIATHNYHLNEHFEPSSWRLSAFTAHSSMIKFDFIAKIEEFEADWAIIVQRMQNLSHAQKQELMQLIHGNSRPEDARSKLSDAGIQRMCASDLYKFDWECFGYELPDVCKQ